MNKINNFLNRIKGKNILIQGLGLNGGGVGTAKFFLENDIKITITDMKSEDALKKSVLELEKYKDKIHYVLGEHREIDFQKADIVVKGPGVPPTNKFIQIAMENGAEITSDIAIFLEISPCPIYAITGSKGKSTTVSAINSIFKAKTENTFLGGNITISPLTFYDKLDSDSLLILELSSWQLRDIKGHDFKFKGTCITNLLNDHGNYYSNMIDYLSDKKIITENQDQSDFFIIPENDKNINLTNIKTYASVYYFSNNSETADLFIKNGAGFFNDKKNKKNIELFNDLHIKIPGEHTKVNMLIAAGFCYLAGIDVQTIQKGISEFKGAPYRLEFIRKWQGIRFYNDTTATIPDALYFAVKAFKTPLILIAGGNDKNLDFSMLKDIASIPKKIFLLKGDGTEKMKKVLNRNDIVEGDSLPKLLESAVSCADSGDSIILSPGCTSFGLFNNEFHRGDVFNEFVRGLK